MGHAIKIKYLSQEIDKVNYSREGDAAFDLRASGKWVINIDREQEEIEQESYELKPNERIVAKAGIELEIPKGHWGNIRDRSGLALKHGIHTLGGVIDETYRGEICIIILNTSQKNYEIKKNDRIAQMVITPYQRVEIIEDELSESSRGRNGFGSSGK